MNQTAGIHGIKNSLEVRTHCLRNGKIAPRQFFRLQLRNPFFFSLTPLLRLSYSAPNSVSPQPALILTKGSSAAGRNKIAVRLSRSTVMQEAKPWKRRLPIDPSEKENNLK